MINTDIFNVIFTLCGFIYGWTQPLNHMHNSLSGLFNFPWSQLLMILYYYYYYYFVGTIFTSTTAYVKQNSQRKKYKMYSPWAFAAENEYELS